MYAHLLLIYIYDQQCVCSVGHEAQQQALLELLEAFEADTLVTYVGAAKQVLLQALRRLSEELGVAALVDLRRGQQEAPEQVLRFMQEADVLVNPIVVGKLSHNIRGLLTLP